MKQISLLLILIIILTACGAQSSPPVENVTIDYALEPDPPAVGRSTLLITVTGADGAGINGATVSIHGDMDHAGMTPIDAETTDGVDGVYAVPFEWTMGGAWILDITVTLPDNRGLVTERFEIAVGAIAQDSIINQTGANSDASLVIRYEPDNDPAIAGDAEVTVIVLGADGLPLADASVSFHATMPEHEILPIDAESTEAISGRYVIPIRWTMAGDWLVDITVTQTDATELTETFEQLVVMPE